MIVRLRKGNKRVCAGPREKQTASNVNAMAALGEGGVICISDLTISLSFSLSLSCLLKTTTTTKPAILVATAASWVSLSCGVSEREREETEGEDCLVSQLLWMCA